MKVVKQHFEIMSNISPGGILELKLIEKAGRTCYKSEPKLGTGPEAFVKRIIERGHESVLEHSSLTVRFTCDRAIANEIVRHRLAAYSQESTRYCNYGLNKFGNEITVIEPPGLSGENRPYWLEACEKAEVGYFEMLEDGCTPEIARSVLPLCLATHLVVTANYREWRHILRLRTDKAAHPQIRELMGGLLEALKKRIPVVFDDIEVAE